MSTAGKYPTRQLGQNGPFVSALGFGAMAIGAFYGSSDEDAFWKTLTYAADRGVTFWDTSDVYGKSEVTLGRWFKETGRRDEIFLSTKFGGFDLTPGVPNKYKPNSKPSYILHQLQASLDALQTDHIDLYYQHRVDPEVPIEVVLETLRPEVEKGRVRWIGLSECNIKTLERATAVPGVGDKVVAAQMEFSPFELGLEKSGFAATAKRLGVAVVAYSPLCRGLVSGRFRSRADFGPDDARLSLPRFSEENFPKNLEVVDKFIAIAKKLNATPSQVALAWILAEHPDFIPIPGSRSVDRFEDNAKGAEIKLSEQDIKELRHFIENAGVAGDRYGGALAATVVGDCIPLSEWKGE